MKILKYIFMLFMMSFLSISYTNATYTSTVSKTYNAPIFDGSIKFSAELKDGKVYTSWTKYNKSESFRYYKVIRSTKISNPVYPDQSYIKYASDVNFGEFIDSKVQLGTNYYRVCAITNGKDGDKRNRYCSNVVKIINNTESNISTGEKPTICTMEYSPVCGEKNGVKKTYGNKCNLEAVGAKKLYYGKCKPIYIIPKNCNSWYDGCNTCGVKDGKTTFCTRMYCKNKAIPKCLKYSENIVKTVVLSNRLKAKADVIVVKFLKKIEAKYKDNNKRISVLKSVVVKLNKFTEKKPKAKILVDYINSKINEKIAYYDDDLGDLENIFNEY